MTTALKPVPVGTRTATGDICPKGGIWGVEYRPHQTAFIGNGIRMPQFDGKPVVWVLI